MSLEQFMNEAISPWMRVEGPENDIVLSTRIRLARNFEKVTFPIIANEDELRSVIEFMKENYEGKSYANYQNLAFIEMEDLSHIEKRVLVEKHLISPFLTKARASGVLVSENEQLSIMVNEEDHIRIQLYFPGFQMKQALDHAFELDDWLEEKIDFAFDERWGYLTSCPTNVGTGMRASVMIHLPALVLTKRINQMIPAINQFGFVVRGIYGEGTEALGNLFQVSNQITLGKSEEDIVEDLESVIINLVEQEREARHYLLHTSGKKLEDQIFRSYGILKYGRIIESQEASARISDVRLGVDLGMIKDVSHNVLNELMVLTQPGFLQHYAKKVLTTSERDVLRATLIRERLNI
ncbi:MAG: protein arginine kinase [Bacilli bacterium]|nr:protein arginine kinase [Bacilli bacterium]